MRRLSYPQRSLDHLGFPAVSWYGNRIRSTAPNNLIGYWPLIDPSGAVARNYGLGGTARNGAITGGLLNQQPGIGDGHGCYVLDGSGDFVNIHSASLAADFNGAEGTLIAWAKVAAASVWEDGIQRFFARFFVDASNRLQIYKNTASNSIVCQYTAGGTDLSVNIAVSLTSYLALAMTWSRSAGANGQFIAYLSGAQNGSTQTGLGTWAGLLSSTNTVIGSLNTTPANVYNGSLAHVALWSVALTPTQIFYLSRV